MRRFYLLAAIVLSAATSVCVFVAVQGGDAPDRDLLDLDSLTVGLMIVAWLMLDPKLPREERPTFDHAFLLMVSFPVLALYQQCVGHRWKGVAIVAGLMAIVLLPWLTWITAFIIGQPE